MPRQGQRQDILKPMQHNGNHKTWKGMSLEGQGMAKTNPTQFNI